jgi:hypothetical protein
MLPGGASGSVGVVNGVEWFWAIVCNIVVIGGALLTVMLFGYWFRTVPQRHRGASPGSGNR